MKKIEELDSQCGKIFSVLAVNLNPITFNKLFEKAKTRNDKTDTDKTPRTSANNTKS